MRDRETREAGMPGEANARKERRYTQSWARQAWAMESNQHPLDKPFLSSYILY